MGGASPALPGERGGDLLYVSDQETDVVDLYSYPSLRKVGVLTGFESTPAGMCTDRNQNVWITAGSAGAIFEFAHGGSTPFNRLSVPGEFPIDCSISPATGDLAVTSLSGHVLVFPNASGSPAAYTDPSMAKAWFCGYDPKGDLFVDGIGPSSNFVFAALRKGKGSLSNITLSVPVAAPGGVQWDGRDLTVADGESGYVYRVDRATGQVIKMIDLNLVGERTGGFWIQGRRIVVPVVTSNTVGIWRYPHGSEPIKKISGFGELFGVTISKGTSANWRGNALRLR
jgi:hypothetical protein